MIKEKNKLQIIHSVKVLSFTFFITAFSCLASSAIIQNEGDTNIIEGKTISELTINNISRAQNIKINQSADLQNISNTGIDLTKINAKAQSEGSIPSIDSNGKLIFKIINTNNLPLPTNIGNNEIADGAVTENKIASQNVGDLKFANGSFTEAKIADSSINSEKFVPGSILPIHIANSATILDQKIPNFPNAAVIRTVIDSASSITNAIDTLNQRVNDTKSRILSKANSNNNTFSGITNINGNVSVQTPLIVNGDISAGQILSSPNILNSVADLTANASTPANGVLFQSAQDTTEISTGGSFTDDQVLGLDFTTGKPNWRRIRIFRTNVFTTQVGENCDTVCRNNFGFCELAIKNNTQNVSCGVGVFPNNNESLRCTCIRI